MNRYPLQNSRDDLSQGHVCSTDFRDLYRTVSLLLLLGIRKCFIDCQNTRVTAAKSEEIVPFGSKTNKNSSKFRGKTVQKVKK